LGFSEVNLNPELGIATDLSGHLEVKGPLDAYRGRIRIVNKGKGWTEGKLSGEFQGDLQGVKISKLDAGWIDGTVQGSLAFSWARGLEAEGRLQGAGLNPARFHSEWKGNLNLKLEGRVLSRQDRLSEAAFKAHFSESLLRDHRFTGEVQAGLEKDFWRIARLQVRGQGFDLEARGVLREQVQVEARFTDLSKVMADLQGRLLANGWLRYRENQLTGVFHGKGNDLSTDEFKAGSFTADIRLNEPAADGQPAFDLDARLENLQIGSFPVQALSLETSGVLKTHKARLAANLEEGEIQGELEGGYENGRWKGTLARMTGKEPRALWSLSAPADIQLSARQLRLGPLSARSTRGERVRADADLAWAPLSGSLRLEWGNLDLARLTPWLRGGNLSGQSTGSLAALWRKNGVQIAGDLGLKGAFSRDPLKLEAFSAKANCAWNENGLRTTLALDLGQEGNLEIRLTSAEPVQKAPPRSGKISGTWKGVAHTLLSPLFPPKLLLRGQSSGQASGQWSPDGQVEMGGEVRTTRTEVVWQEEAKPLAVTLQKADLNFTWQGESLRGGVSLTIEEHGLLKGTFHLPLAARLHPSFHSGGPLALAVKGQLQEKGFLAARYPEWIAKSRGNVDLDFNAGGTWNQPQFKGALRVADTAIRFSPGGEKLPAGDGPDLLHLEVSSGSADLEWGDRGLRSSWVLKSRKHGTVEGQIVSSEPARLALPKAGQLEIGWTALDVGLLKPLGPKELFLEGTAAGQVKGNWLPEGRLEAKGELKLSRGKFSWRAEHGLISAGLRQGDVDFSWGGEGLQGNLLLILETYGSLQGNFRLPLPARIPLRFDPARALRVSLRGQAEENGLVSAVFPGTVQESRGKVDLELQVVGTWASPDLQGSLQFTDGGAFLPGLGIRVEDLSLRCRLRDQRIQIEDFKARSGPGQIEGSGTVRLKNWEVQGYEGKIRGDKFQTFYLPDLRIQSSPKLDFQGAPPGLSVKGEILLPEVLIQEVGGAGMVRPSSDVVIMDRPVERVASFPLDMEVRIVLGDRVTVKAGGVDARLAGNLDLKAGGVQPDQISTRGEIRVVEGSYTGYGLNLRIDRGRLFFAGGPVDNPGLDILALRRADDLEGLRDIKVGVTILGSLKRPIVKLYSNPAMKDEDILSYLVTGQAYDPKSANLSLLVVGAGALLGGDSPGPVDQLKSKIGIDRVDIESQGGDMSRSMLSIGKYLTPQLYISYGYSVFDNEQSVKVRYKLSKRWEVEATRGANMAVDLYYRIEFF
jgi:autotransporter translocation and assembly factor TamB